MMTSFGFLCTGGGFMCEGPTSLLWIPIGIIAYLIMYAPYYVPPIAVSGLVISYIFEKIKQRKPSRRENAVIWAISIIVWGTVVSMFLIVIPNQHAHQEREKITAERKERAAAAQKENERSQNEARDRGTPCTISSASPNEEKHVQSGFYINSFERLGQASHTRWITIADDTSTYGHAKEFKICSDTVFKSKGATVGFEAIEFEQNLTVEYVSGNYGDYALIVMVN